MNYADTLTYLYANLPMFQRVGAAAYNRDLTNTLALCEELGNPQKQIKCIHIAGTNGKGSSSHMLAAILQSAGYKTGLYTSPHLKEFTERIRINGIEITQEFIVDFVERIKPAIERIHPSFFEITVAMAFDYFNYEQIEIAVIETGLGGRLDSTNIIEPIVSLITNISWDHKDLLGDTLPKIATEKAGIIKLNVPIIISERQAEVSDVFISTAKDRNSRLLFAADSYGVKKLQDGVYEVRNNNSTNRYELDLLGVYQAKNIRGVLAVVDELRRQGYNITNEQLAYGLRNITGLTGLKGRWQRLDNNPLTICDTGHNEAGIKEILTQIADIKFAKLHWVLGMVKDKDVSSILQLLPKDATYYFCQASIPRAMPAHELHARAQSVGLNGVVVQDVNAAIAQARANSSKDDLIMIGGSTFVVAEIENL